MNYPWFKMYSAGILRGSMVQDMSLEQQGVWIRLLAFANEVRLRDGTLRFAIGKPMPHEYIANQIVVPVELLNEVILIATMDTNKLDGNHRIDIWEDGTIQITNWDRFQSSPKRNGNKPSDVAQDKVTWDSEHKEARDKSMAFRGGYKNPDDAKAGINAREFEETIKETNKKIVHESRILDVP